MIFTKFERFKTCIIQLKELIRQQASEKRQNKLFNWYQSLQDLKRRESLPERIETSSKVFQIQIKFLIILTQDLDQRILKKWGEVMHIGLEDLTILIKRIAYLLILRLRQRLKRKRRKRRRRVQAQVQVTTIQVKRKLRNPKKSKRRSKLLD